MRTRLLAVILIACGGCAKVGFSRQAGPSAANPRPTAAVRDFAAERAALVRTLRDRYGLDVSQPVSRWSCCGVAWERYPDRDLAFIRLSFDRILELSADGETHGDRVATQTRYLRHELGRNAEGRLK